MRIFKGLLVLAAIILGLHQGVAGASCAIPQTDSEAQLVDDINARMNAEDVNPSGAVSANVPYSGANAAARSLGAETWDSRLAARV